MPDGISIYPNPSTGTINISLNRQDAFFDIYISDLSGRNVATLKNVKENLITTTIPGPAGIYFISITTSDGEKYMAKVVKTE